MKKIIIRLAFILVAVGLFASCETDMEKAQNEYSATQVFPVVLGVTGNQLMLQTFSTTYTPTYYRAGSTWTWSVTDATLTSVSADTRTATVTYNTLPASDTALIKVKETTAGGTVSAEYVVKVRVNPFCPLANGLSDMVGTWSGEDAWYPADVTTAVNGTTLNVTGINSGFIADWWGEPIVSGGTFAMTVNNDGTLSIPRQYIFTTIYGGSNYDYEIAGIGTWDNCAATPTMILKYDIYYPGDLKGLAATYSSYLDGATFMTATLTMED